ncbi:FAD-dependent monooxygenase [Streptomyces tateyamensis]|uniref:FAD-dependent monooxygenase n=1 Tax=Streptomyces tateyamensis TaxID=565073 RepID=A0A2V4N9B1_9ACTN|nr:NAD(P)/FAD-dependent oxidoreductase [Streptomyces tateyamensis]PYC69777.1 FAD-dependent monooxygenase [Streptomyces tateyamensis]
MRSPRIAVVGAGLGGLCVAQGLRRAGLEVEVYERDAAPGARQQGYRLHVDARTGLALRDCLPAELFQLFLATCGLPGRAFTVLTEQLRLLHRTPLDPAADPYAPQTLSTSVDRRTLREVLSTGLGQQIHYQYELTGFQQDAEGVALRFANGHRTRADLLVGADGVNSAVRRGYLPHARVADTGGRVVYGRTELTAAVEPLLPAPLREGFTAVVAGRLGLATGLVRFRRPPEQAAAWLSPAGDYLMWALAGPAAAFGQPDGRLAELDPGELHKLVGRLTTSFHPDLRELLAAATVADTFLVRVRCAEPVPAWQPTRVTVLGDAIHAMSPARGSGANTALQDAALLCRTLIAALAEGGDLVTAIGAYEAEMREYGFAAVAASREAEAAVGARHGGPVGRLLRRLGSRPLGS